MDRLFSTYITPQIKEIYHPEIIQERKLNIDSAEYEKNMTLTHVPSTKKYRKDEFKHWPKSIKSTMQCFTSSLLKMFSMLEIRLSVGDIYLDSVSLKCINCKRETGLKTKYSLEEFYDKIITPFVMNSMLHHVGMSWIISSTKEMDYYNFTNSKNLGWFDTGPWHNTNICS